MSDRDLMNGTSTILRPEEQFKAHPQLVKMAEDILAGVKAGKIVSLACITVSPLGQMGWPGFGLHMAEMMIAAEMMRDDMKAAMRKGGQSQIVRAGG